MKILIANWKMNPQTLTEACDLFKLTFSKSAKYPGIKTIICPPFIFLEELSNQLKNNNYALETFSLGAQDIFWEPKGAFTGEVSPEMLKNIGVSHVLIGHSDRRYTIGESDEVINKKIKAALAVEITPVLLIGEREGEKREETLKKQLSTDLLDLSTLDVDRILFAYEPVWAISTNPNARPDTPEKTIGAINYIKNYLLENWKLKIEDCLYGGSVNEKNVVDFLKHPEISGAVVGGASLKKEEFGNMIKLASEIK